MPLTIVYKPIEKNNIAKVELCNREDSDFQQYWHSLITKPIQNSNKHILLYQRHIKEFDEFYKTFCLFYHGDLSLIETCGSCVHCSPDKYHNSGFICWFRWTQGRPKQTFFDRTCNNFDSRFDSQKTLEEKCLRATWDFLRFGEKINDKYIQCFNKAILANLLRDCYHVNIKKEVNIGNQARKYENEIAHLLEKWGIPILPSILKYWYNSSYNPQFKIMDFHFEIDWTHYILEVFTLRNKQEKSVQASDYLFLLQKALPQEKIKAILITENYGDPALHSEGRIVGNIPLYTKNGLDHLLRQVLN